MVKPETDPLVDFAAWYMERGASAVPRSVHSGVRFVGHCAGITLFRQGEFQVQLWLCQPNSEVPDHRHPNIDQIQIYVSGEVALRWEGNPAVDMSKLQDVDEHGCSVLNGRFIRVRPGESHGATIGPNGGAFMGIQRWLNGKAGDTELDWVGEPLSEEHAAAIAQG